MYRSEYIVCFRSEISFVPLLFSHRTPFLRPYWQIYFNSTSNHNTLQNYHNAYGVVSYFHFTSNHNIRLFRHRFIRLFLISILHQTTTLSYHPIRQDSCFLFPFYIKPQLADFFLRFREGCFLFPFYIKPQLHPRAAGRTGSCFLFPFYIKPQLAVIRRFSGLGCFLFPFYIKPQRFQFASICL